MVEFERMLNQLLPLSQWVFQTSVTVDVTLLLLRQRPVRYLSAQCHATLARITPSLVRGPEESCMN
jgi:hypothetical protein